MGGFPADFVELDERSSTWAYIAALLSIFPRFSPRLLAIALLEIAAVPMRHGHEHGAQREALDLQTVRRTD